MDRSSAGGCCSVSKGKSSVRDVKCVRECLFFFFFKVKVSELVSFILFHYIFASFGLRPV